MRFNPEKEIGDLSGKVVLVTGGNVGIGASIVKALAPKNPHIYICARRVPSAEALIAEIHTTHPDAKLSVLPLDLSSFESIKACAAQFNAESSRLDLLFLNAGIAAVTPSLTKEGFEQQFGVNHVGHALLTQLLMPRVLSTSKSGPDADTRIILTSSVGGHRFAPAGGLQLAEMHKPDPLGAGMSRYGHSKLANMLFVRKLAQVYPGVTSLSFHPGTVKTEIWGKASGAKMLITLLSPMVWLTGVSCDEGARPGLWCATAKVGPGKGMVENGKYYVPELKTDVGKFNEDQKLTDELWEWTNKELANHGAPGWPEA